MPQNAPLGRAVIGGLSVATITTLLFVPIVYSFIHRHAGAILPEEDPNDGETEAFAKLDGRGLPETPETGE